MIEKRTQAVVSNLRPFSKNPNTFHSSFCRLHMRAFQFSFLLFASLINLALNAFHGNAAAFHCDIHFIRQFHIPNGDLPPSSLSFLLQKLCSHLLLPFSTLPSRGVDNPNSHANHRQRQKRHGVKCLRSLPQQQRREHDSADGYDKVENGNPRHVVIFQ